MIDEFIEGVREAERQLEAKKEALAAARDRALAEGGTTKTAKAIVDAEQALRQAEVLLEVREQALKRARAEQDAAERAAAAKAREAKIEAYEQHEADLVRNTIEDLLGLAEQAEQIVRRKLSGVERGEELVDEINALAERAAIPERLEAVDENTLLCAAQLELRRFFGRPEVDADSLQHHPALQQAAARIGHASDLRDFEHRLEGLSFEATAALGASVTDWLTPAPDELMATGTFTERAEAARALLERYFDEPEEEADDANAAQ